MYNRYEIGRRIKGLRDDISINQEKLAKDLNISREALAKWETGDRDIKNEFMIKLADYFNVTCDYILRGIRADSVEVSQKTGLTQIAIDQLEGINNIKSNKRDQKLRIINGILINKAFYTHILKHGENAITIHDGDPLGGHGKHTEAPGDIKKMGEDARENLKWANELGYTDYIPTPKGVAIDTQIQYATDAFKEILEHIVRPEKKNSDSSGL